MLSIGDVGDRNATVYQVPRCSDLQTPVYQNFELILHSLWDVEPVQFIIQQLCQTTVVLAEVQVARRAAVFSTRCSLPIIY